MSKKLPLLISVPSIELNRVRPDGAIFDARKLTTAPFSNSLLQAVQVVLDRMAPHHSEILCVARPEMFTHGQSLEWLRERIKGAATHLCISNGQTLKLIPGLRNHAFVYGLHREGSLRQYRAMLRRAPELLAGFERQYNTVHETDVAQGDASPPSEVLVPARPYKCQAINWCYPFYLNRHSHPDSVERMFKWARNDLPLLEPYERLVVVDCNESAMQDHRYCHALAQLVAAASSNMALCLLLVMPDAEDPKTTAMERMTRVLEGVQRGHVAVPRVRMDNVHLVTELDEAEFLALNHKFELMLHESSPLWAYTTAFYGAATAVRLYKPRKSLNVRTRLAPMQQTLLGRAAVNHGWTQKFISRFGLEAH